MHVSKNCRIVEISISNTGITNEPGGIVKTATISFGQAMPLSEMQAAEAETLACDLFLSIGSSLVVYPAAGFPELAKRNGAKLVILNRDGTSLDRIADLVLNTEIGPTLSQVVDLRAEEGVGHPWILQHVSARCPTARSERSWVREI